MERVTLSQWQGDRPRLLRLPLLNDIHNALTAPPSSPLSLGYRRMASSSTNKAKRNEYQKERSKTDRASLKALKTSNPEAYARLLAEVTGRG